MKIRVPNKRFLGIWDQNPRSSQLKKTPQFQINKPKSAEIRGGAPSPLNPPIYVSSRVCATGHIKDPVPLIEKRRGLPPGGQSPPSFIHQVDSNHHHRR